MEVPKIVYGITNNVRCKQYVQDELVNNGDFKYIPSTNMNVGPPKNIPPGMAVLWINTIKLAFNECMKTLFLPWMDKEEERLQNALLLESRNMIGKGLTDLEKQIIDIRKNNDKAEKKWMRRKSHKHTNKQNNKQNQNAPPPPPPPTLPPPPPPPTTTYSMNNHQHNYKPPPPIDNNILPFKIHRG